MALAIARIVTFSAASISFASTCCSVNPSALSSAVVSAAVVPTDVTVVPMGDRIAGNPAEELE
jgi:hypothetical protein